MPKLTPLQWGAVLLIAGLIIYFGFFYKKAPAAAPAGKGGAAPAGDEKKFGTATAEKLVLSQVGG